MNYNTGRKIVISAMAANLVTLILSNLLLRILPINAALQFNIFANYIYILIPSFAALGFAMIYSVKRDKFDFALACAAAIQFVAVFISTVIIVVNESGYIFVHTLFNCLCAIFPLAWAMKLRSKIPALSIAMIVAGVWCATCTILAMLPVYTPSDIFGSFYSALLSILSYGSAVIYLVAALLDKTSEAKIEDASEDESDYDNVIGYGEN